MNNAAFGIASDQLYSRKTGKSVPFDEPIFILRGRDMKALATIRSYQSIFSPASENWKMIQEVLDDFAGFKKDNLQTMTEPEDLY